MTPITIPSPGELREALLLDSQIPIDWEGGNQVDAAYPTKDSVFDPCSDFGSGDDDLWNE
jgi:hypothetical protein